jgi:alpha-ribazole phosphatase
MEIVLVRHGETEYNNKRVFHGWIDSDLNDKGIMQAQKAARLLEGESIDIIFSSPLKRAVTTAEIIARANNNTPVSLASEIKEISFGLFEGLTYQEICEKYGMEVKKWENEPLKYCFPGGEGVQAFYERIKGFLNGLSNKEYKRVVLVTHEGCIRCILSHVTSSSTDVFWKYSIKVGSISRVIINKDFSYILSLNENYKETDTV